MEYPYIKAVSQRAGVSEQQMHEIFDLENNFHKQIRQEEDFEKRQKLYEHVYTAVGRFFNTDEEAYFQHLVKVKTKIAYQLRRDIAYTALLDVGCGNGSFLYALAKTSIPMKATVGLDIKSPQFPVDEYSSKVSFIQQNIIKFNLNQRFDTLLLDNVYEHIAPQDKVIFLESLRKACNPKATMIMIVPHRMFGPTDFTTILDNTQSGQILAQCVHLNETTYTDLIADLRTIGFTQFYTTIPFIVLSPLRNIFPALRLPARWFVAIENSPRLVKFMQSIKIKGRCLFRMEVIIIAR